MVLRKISILLITLGIVVAIPLGIIIWNESFYFDLLPFLSPIEYSGNLPIRNDLRGEGDFGARRSGKRRHQGLDIAAPVGAPVRAARGGMAFTGNHPRGLGKFVEIKHKDDMVTIYSHLSKICINPIQRVRQGRIIGEVGKTGNARYKGIDTHLHFEVRVRGVAVDPKKYLLDEPSD
jgi:murein DD-endopeptidase MepM/ murein hydrolase activator NlpD